MYPDPQSGMSYSQEPNNNDDKCFNSDLLVIVIIGDIHLMGEMSASNVAVLRFL